MDRDGWQKPMAHFASMCCSSPLNIQVLFYNGHDNNFDDRALDIPLRHNIQYFILKADDSVHDQSNDNGPKMNLKNFYGNARIKCTSAFLHECHTCLNMGIFQTIIHKNHPGNFQEDTPTTTFST